MFSPDSRTPSLPASVAHCFLPEPHERTMLVPLTLIEALTATSAWECRPSKSRQVHSGVGGVTPSGSLPHK